MPIGVTETATTCLHGTSDFASSKLPKRWHINPSSWSKVVVVVPGYIRNPSSWGCCLVIVSILSTNVAIIIMVIFGSSLLNFSWSYSANCMSGLYVKEYFSYCCVNAWQSYLALAEYVTFLLYKKKLYMITACWLLTWIASHAYLVILGSVCQNSECFCVCNWRKCNVVGPESRSAELAVPEFGFGFWTCRFGFGQNHNEHSVMPLFGFHSNRDRCQIDPRLHHFMEIQMPQPRQPFPPSLLL